MAKDDKSEIESISWADQEEEHTPGDDNVDLSRFGGEEPEGDELHHGHQDFAEDGLGHLDNEEDDPEQPEEEENQPPFFKRKWFVILVVVIIVVGAFSYGFYKSKARQTSKNPLLAEQQPHLPQINEDAGAPPPMILPEEGGEPKTELSTPAPAPAQEELSVAAQPSPAPVAAVAQSTNTAPAIVQPNPVPVAAPENNFSGENKKFKAYVDQEMSRMRAMINDNEIRHRAELRKLQARLDSTSNDLKKRAVASSASQPITSVPSAPLQPQSMPGYRLQSIVPDRAWVVLPDESVKSVVVGSILPGGLRVEKIIAQEQQVVTNKGIIK